jgi:hypothetical protein
MTHRLFFSPLIWGLAAGIALCAQPRESRADSVPVDPGYDLFTTATGSQYDFGGAIGLQSLMGVPLGTYNFGGTIGVQNVSTTDTIISRLSSVTTSGGTTSLLVDALQLETVNAIPSLDNQHLFITLTPTVAPTASVASTGSMTINSGSPGTFTSTLDLNLDIHLGSLTGPVESSITNLVLTNSGDTWSHTNTTPGAVMIPGVNYLLNGVDTSTDFWPGVPLMEDSSGAAHHYVDPGGTTTIPEPSSWVLGAIAVVIGMAGAGWRRRRAA